MSRMDRDLEDFANLLIAAADRIKHSINVSSYNDCNDCGDKNNCPYLTKLGQMVRINCPLWTEQRREE